MVVLPVFVGGLLELAPRCPRSGDAGAAINHPPAPPPRPLPPPTQPSADAKSGTGRLERRQAPPTSTCRWAVLERPRRDTNRKEVDHILDKAMRVKYLYFSVSMICN